MQGLPPLPVRADQNKCPMSLRARGFRDTGYLKLIIYQLNAPDKPSFLYADAPALVQKTACPPYENDEEP
jgi:hypothetical protein